jgi:hypothetical protein
MSDTVHTYLANYKSDSRVDGVVAVDCRGLQTQLVDEFDFLFLVILADESAEVISHYKQGDLRIQEQRVTREGLERWMLTGANRNIMQWVLGGTIELDRSGWLTALREQWTLFPTPLRDKKLMIEFAAFLRVYTRCQEYLRTGQVMDAYSQVNAMLHHWARIYITEAGLHPEVMVWRQVYDINPGVYKMYQELQESDETLEQRVELVLLAIDFSIIRRITDCNQLLLQMMRSRDEAWAVHELQQQPQIAELEIDLNLILQKLVEKRVIQEVAVPLPNLSGIHEMRYKA